MTSGIGHWHLYSAVRISARYQFPGGEPNTKFGTGFLVECTQQNERFALVSNRHILDRAWSEPLWDGAELIVDVDIWGDRNTKATCKIFPSKVFTHPDPTIDVAAVAFDRIYTPKESEVEIVLSTGIPWEYLIRAEENWEKIEPSETVFLPGYPQWYDRNGGRPIMRTGAIVSDPRSDYRQREGDPSIHDGERQILFEAFSSDGNSGSPVYVAQRGLPSSDHIQYTGVYHPSLLVGINAGHMQVPGDAIEDSKGAIHLTNWHVGLSRMFKTSAIAEVVSELSETYIWSDSDIEK